MAFFSIKAKSLARKNTLHFKGQCSLGIANILLADKNETFYLLSEDVRLRALPTFKGPNEGIKAVSLR